MKGPLRQIHLFNLGSTLATHKFKNSSNLPLSISSSLSSSKMLTGAAVSPASIMLFRASSCSGREGNRCEVPAKTWALRSTLDGNKMDRNAWSRLPWAVCLRPLSHPVLVAARKEHATTTLSTCEEEPLRPGWTAQISGRGLGRGGLCHCEGLILSLDNKSPWLRTTQAKGQKRNMHVEDWQNFRKKYLQLL